MKYKATTSARLLAIQHAGAAQRRCARVCVIGYRPTSHQLCPEQAEASSHVHRLLACSTEIQLELISHDCVKHYFTVIKTLVLKLPPEASQALAVIRRWKLNDPKVMDASMLAPVPIALATPST